MENHFTNTACYGEAPRQWPWVRNSPGPNCQVSKYLNPPPPLLALRVFHPPTLSFLGDCSPVPSSSQQIKVDPTFVGPCT